MGSRITLHHNLSKTISVVCYANLITSFLLRTIILPDFLVDQLNINLSDTVVTVPLNFIRHIACLPCRCFRPYPLPLLCSAHTVLSLLPFPHHFCVLLFFFFSVHSLAAYSIDGDGLEVTGAG